MILKRLKENMAPLSLILLIPFTNLLYEFLNNSSRGVHYLVTALDRGVPFIKVFAVPYLLWYPFILGGLVYLCINSREEYYKALRSIVAGMLICCFFYYIFQTSVPRPQLNDNGFMTGIVGFIYSSDNPYNCFPSIHVFTSYVIMKSIGNTDASKKVKSTAILIGVAVILSTQFIKQHVLIDMVFAMLLANYIYMEEYLWIGKVFSSLMMKRKSEI